MGWRRNRLVRGIMNKIKICFEHADGKPETISMTPALALATLERVLEPGWPWITPVIEGKRIKERDRNCVNAFLTWEGERIVL